MALSASRPTARSVLERPVFSLSKPVTADTAMPATAASAATPMPTGPSEPTTLTSALPSPVNALATEAVPRVAATPATAAAP